MTSRLPRALHAGAWWLWAIGLGAAATRTTNPLILGMIISGAAVVVALRRPQGGSANGFRLYLILALIVIAIRVVFRALLGGGLGSHVLFTLPAPDMPNWASGITVGGPVTAESILAALYDGMRLAAIVVCVGAANTLADPRRLLRSLPRSLYDVGTAVALALSLAPQLVESVARVRRARRLRGESTRWWQARSLIVPVLEDAMQRSLSTAAAMDSRGYGRVGHAAPARARGRLAALLGIGLVLAGLFGLITGGGTSLLAVLGLIGGCSLGGFGFVLAGRNVGRSTYRPLRWKIEEWVVAASGLSCGAAIWFLGWVTPAAVSPPVEPLVWPSVPVVATLAIGLATLAGSLAPPSEPRRAPVLNPGVRGGVVS